MQRYKTRVREESDIQRQLTSCSKRYMVPHKKELMLGSESCELRLAKRLSWGHGSERDV